MNAIFRTINLEITNEIDFIQSIRDNYQTAYDSIIEIGLPVKIRLHAQVTFDRPDDIDTTLTVWVSTIQQEILTAQSIHEAYNRMLIDQFNHSIDAAQMRGSGWITGTLNALELRLTKYNPIQGRSYLELPKEVYDKKAVINIRNSDNFCFAWCILAKLFPAKKNADRVSHYQPFTDKLNWNNIAFPVKLDDIDVFEEQNKGISVNVYYWDEVKKLVPLRISKYAPMFDNQKNHVDLLLITDPQNPLLQHYTLIHTMSCLISYTTKSTFTQRKPEAICSYCSRSWVEGNI